MKMIIKLIALLLLISCGKQETEKEVITRKKSTSTIELYTFDDFKKYCFGCHNQTAPTIPTDEVAFKASAKVKTRILNGTMPPSKGDFDINKAIKYFN